MLKQIFLAFIRRNELFSFVLVFPQILKDSCITAELVEALSAFNPYKGFDMSLFTWENILATYDNPDHNDIDCTLHALEVYHSWVDDKVQSLFLPSEQKTNLKICHLCDREFILFPHWLLTFILLQLKILIPGYQKAFLMPGENLDLILSLFLVLFRYT